TLVASVHCPPVAPARYTCTSGAFVIATPSNRSTTPSPVRRRSTVPVPLCSASTRPSSPLASVAGPVLGVTEPGAKLTVGAGVPPGNDLAKLHELIGAAAAQLTRLGERRRALVDHQAGAAQGVIVQLAHRRRERADRGDVHAGREPDALEHRCAAGGRGDDD